MAAGTGKVSRAHPRKKWSWLLLVQLYGVVARLAELLLVVGEVGNSELGNDK